MKLKLNQIDKGYVVSTFEENVAGASRAARFLFLLQRSSSLMPFGFSRNKNK